MRLSDIYFEKGLEAITRTAAQGSPNNNLQATGLFTLVGLPVVDEEIVIGVITYVWKAAANSVGEITIGGDIDGCITALQAAIAGTDGINAAHPEVTGVVNLVDDNVAVTAIDPGPDGNAIETTTTVANGSWANPTLINGVLQSVPTQLNQLCIVGENTNKLQFLAISIDPVQWVLVGPELVIEDPNNEGQYIEITSDGLGALGYQPYDLNL